MCCALIQEDFECGVYLLHMIFSVLCVYCTGIAKYFVFNVINF